MSALIGNGQYLPSGFTPNGNWDPPRFLADLYKLLTSLASRISNFFSGKITTPIVPANGSPPNAKKSEMTSQNPITQVASRTLPQPKQSASLVTAHSPLHIREAESQEIGTGIHPEAIRLCQIRMPLLDDFWLRDLKIPILPPGEKRFYKMEDGMEGQNIYADILVDGKNAYLIFDAQEEHQLLGSHGATHYPVLGIDLRRGKKVLAQTVYIPQNTENANARRSRIDNEIRAANLCNGSPFFPRLLSHVKDVERRGTTDEGLRFQAVTYLIFEYREKGNLQKYITNHDKLYKQKGPQVALQDALQITYDVFRGLHFLHGQKLGHCDMKPENIVLYESNGRLRANIIDLETVTPFGQKQQMCTHALMVSQNLSLHLSDDDLISSNRRDFLSTVKELQDLHKLVGSTDSERRGTEYGNELTQCYIAAMNGNIKPLERLAAKHNIQLIQ